MASCNGWLSLRSFPPGSANCSAMTGWSIANRPSVVPSMPYVISALTPTASPSPITGSSPWPMAKSRFTGGIRLTKTKRLMTLSVEEFLRRFLLHLLPRGFVRIRNFGFLANRQRATLLPLCFRLLQSSAETLQPTASPAADRPYPSALWYCPLCGGTMHVVERLSAAQLLLLRSPPHPGLGAA